MSSTVVAICLTCIADLLSLTVTVVICTITDILTVIVVVWSLTVIVKRAAGIEQMHAQRQESRKRQEFVRGKNLLKKKDPDRQTG